MCEKLVCKGIKEGIDKLLSKYGVDVKIFGNPVKEFDFENMDIKEISDVKKLIMKKINKVAI